MIIWVFKLKTREEIGGGLPRGGGFVGGDRQLQGRGTGRRLGAHGRALGAPGRVLGAHGRVLGAHGRVLRARRGAELADLPPLLLASCGFLALPPPFARE